jgi:hypothetical protein
MRIAAAELALSIGIQKAVEQPSLSLAGSISLRLRHVRLHPVRRLPALAVERQMISAIHVPVETVTCANRRDVGCSRNGRTGARRARYLRTF